MPAGRPSTFIQEIFDLICERMAAGQTLREVCRAEGMPPESTVRTWAVLDNPPGIAAQFARAREALCEYWADETIEISDNATNDWVERRKQDGSKEITLDREHIQRSTLRVSQRNWLLSRILRKTYGDKTALEHSGPDGGPILTQDVTDERMDLPAIAAKARATKSETKH